MTLTQWFSKGPIPRRVSVFSVAAVLLVPGAVAAEDYERPLTLKASSFLPADVVAGPNHRVDERVGNDGFLNHYKVHSHFGDFDVVSTAKLRTRVKEIDAIALMEEVQQTDVFAEAAGEVGEDFVKGVEALVTDPEETLSGAVSGVAKMFGRGKEALFGSGRSEAEDSRVESLIGFSKTKREYAYEFGVDAYSRNQALQDRLDEISWAGYSGGLTAGLLLAQVPGGVGAALTVVNTTDLLNEVMRTTSPVDLRKMNRERLMAMGVSEDVADLFVGNSTYTPREQTALVLSLAQMGEVKNRSAFIKFAVLAEEPDIAFFRQRQAQMYAAYHEKIAPIAEFVPIGQLAAARMQDGTLVFAAPLDMLAWTEPMGSYIAAVDRYINETLRPTSKQLWLAGQSSRVAKANLQAMGWQVHEGADSKLLRDITY